MMQSADEIMQALPDDLRVEMQQDSCRLLFQSIAAGYLTAFADPDRPDFVPVVNNVLNSHCANPDFRYGFAQIVGRGSYRLTGFRGEGVFIFFDILAGGIGVMDELGPSVGFIDLDTLQLDEDGGFDVILSAERPAGHEGDWRYLDPRATAITMRDASYHWGIGEDARIAIERIDTPVIGTAFSASETARRLHRLSNYPRRYAALALNHVSGQRDRNFINTLEADDWAGRGGVAGQYYHQGLFHLKADEALILETDLPHDVRYWSVQLGDALWNAIDWVNCQSSLNGGQAVIDDDGKFRAVIAPFDPGVANWLDSAGHLDGSIMLRWTEASNRPEPTLTVAPLAQIRDHLPANVESVSPEMREVRLRQRRRGAQLRRRW